MRGVFALFIGGMTAVAQTPPWPEGAFEPPAGRLAAGAGEGAAALTPSLLRPAQLGTFTLSYTVGPSGIAAGGGIMVDFPKAWFTNPVPLVKPVQTTEPEGFHYIGAAASRAGAKLALSIDNINYDGKVERFRHMITIKTSGDALRRGDTIAVVFAHTTAPYLAGEDYVRVAVDTNGNSEFRLSERPARYTVRSGDATRLALFAPSQAIAGTPVDIQLTAFDRFFNVAEQVTGSVSVEGLGSSPISGRFRLNDRGIIRLSWTPSEEGFYFPSATLGDSGLYAVGGPIRVFAQRPETSIFWGDLHSHSDLSKDAIGRGDFAYARDVTRLDFFASTEHDISDGNADSITPAEWGLIRDNVRRYYEPGRFVTLLAYECSLRGGHHNVFFRDLDGYPWASHRFETIENIWGLLEAGRAITIPHHLGIRWGRSDDPVTGPELQQVKTGRSSYLGGPQVNWSTEHHADLRPALEIYSEHGSSEFFDPNDPLAYEQVKYTGAVSVAGAHYARDAWALGRRVGVVAASDNHVSHPGLQHTGLTAIIAPELTRDAVFDALRERRSYGTTGDRYIIEFEIAGASMGQSVKASGESEGRVLVAAPGELRYVEVVALEYPGKEWCVVSRWNKPGKLLENFFDITLPAGGGVYYLRAEMYRESAGRVSRAWSSPVWVEAP